MTWNGLTNTDDLTCTRDLENLDGGSSGCFNGQLGTGITGPIPTWTPGTSDFSFEIVTKIRAKIGYFEQDNIAFGGLYDSGTGDHTGWSLRGLAGSQQNYVIDFRWNAPGGVHRTYTPPDAGQGYTHICMNFDRSADMEVFVSDVSQGTFSISADVALSMPALDIHPFYAVFWDSINDIPIDPTHPWATPMSDMAIHSRILTAAEITENNRALQVGDYGTDTIVRYDFNQFVDDNGLPITPVKETNRLFIGTGGSMLFHDPFVELDYVDNMPVPQNGELWAPRAVDGTFFVKDVSGNGRHYPIQTRESYSNVPITGRSLCSFADTGA